MRSRIAALCECTVFDIIELSQAGPDGRPRLLLAGDIELTISGVRYAYGSGYVSEDEAWTLIERVCERASHVYGSWNAYWHDVLIATAFRTDSKAAVEEFRETLVRLRDSDWPAASVDWPARGSFIGATSMQHPRTHSSDIDNRDS